MVSIGADQQSVFNFLKFIFIVERKVTRAFFYGVQTIRVVRHHVLTDRINDAHIGNMINYQWDQVLLAELPECKQIECRWRF